MKNQIILCAAAVIAACTISLEVKAQLEVQTSGNVKASKALAVGTNPDNNIALNVYKVGPYNTTTTYGIKSMVTMPPSYNINPSLYGIYGSVDGYNATIINSPQPIIGVYGYARKNVDLAILSAGVAGIAHWRSGVGVYGGINSPISSLSANALYAGYFNGTTKINGTLFSNTLALNGDMSCVDNTRSIPDKVVNSLSLLQPVSYNFKSDSTWKYDKKLQSEMEGKHYGFIAQDVQKVLPELVYEREGHLAVNYVELIPLLVQTIQNLSAEVEELKKGNPKVKSYFTNKNTPNEDGFEAVLYQNNPNPFSVDTKIEYQLPLSTQSAALYVYDMNGLQIEEYPILSFGEGSVIVSGGALDAGMYLYSLIADGQIVDTKRMILTK